MSLHRKRVLQAARELREQFRSSGEFTQQAYRDALPEALTEFRRSAFDGLCDWVADTVDRESTREQDRTDQPNLFPDWVDLSGEYHLGGGRRVAKRHATLTHAEEMIANDERNLAAVSSASARKHEELAALRPYWLPGMTKEQAVAAYLEDNPESLRA